MAAYTYFTYTGGASNSDPDLSLGGTGSTVEIVDPAPGNLFDNVSFDEIDDGPLVEYRAIDLYNSGDAAAEDVYFFFTNTVNSESQLAVWLDVTGALTVANETTEPVGASGNWTEPTVDAKMSLTDLGSTQRHRLWIRRTVDQDATGYSPDEATMTNWWTATP